MAATTAIALALVVFAASCTCGTNAQPTGPGAIVALETETRGLSGLTEGQAGVLWAIGENGDYLLRIDPDGFGVSRFRAVGFPEGADLEAVAALDADSFIVGTETQEATRKGDALLHARLEDSKFIVESASLIDYGLWGLSASGNHGIEGLCYTDGRLVVATELVEEVQGRRWAPIAVLDLDDQTWRPHRLALQSKTGKLAALSCRKVDGRIVALAVERHFGVAQLLQFEVPIGGEEAWIEPERTTDLALLIDPLPNLEGLVWRSDGSAVLLTDNEYRNMTTEPSRLYFVPAEVLR